MNQEKSIGYFSNMKLLEDAQNSQIFLAEYKKRKFILELVDIQKTLQQKETQDCFWSKREILLNIAHRNDTIYKCYQSFEENTQAIFIYKNIDHTFNQIIKPIPLKQATFYAAKLLQAVSLLHSENFIHREISPQSICFINDKLKLKILNYPRKLLNPNHGCVKKVGVLRYMAPEIVKGNSYGIPADIFSCGVIIYELFHGYTPFQGKSEEEFLAECQQEKPLKFHYNVQKNVENLITKMLAFNPNHRLSLKNVDLYVSLKNEYKFLNKFISYFFGTLTQKTENEEYDQIYYLTFKLLKVQNEILKRIQYQVKEKADNLEIEDQILSFMQSILITDLNQWIDLKMKEFVHKATQIQEHLQHNQKYSKSILIGYSLNFTVQGEWIQELKQVCAKYENIILKEWVQQLLSIFQSLN